MSDSDPASSDQPQTIPFHRIYLLGWWELFQSRERILRGMYQNTAKANNVPLEPEASLDEARQTLVKSLPQIMPDSDFARDRLEWRWVLNSRMLSAWTVLWFSLFPAAIAVAFLVVRFNTASVNSVAGAILNLVLAGAIFFVASVVGVLLFAISSKPFHAFVNWLLKTRQF